MSKYNFTMQDVVSEVRKLAQERPDFNYIKQAARGANDSGCSYTGASQTFPNEGEGCIVGQALQRLGVPRERLLLHEGAAGGHVAARLAEVEGDVRSPEYYWLDHAQSAQDMGFTWSGAVALADGDFIKVEDREE